MQFADLRLSEPLLRAVTQEGYTVATPIQAKAIPQVLEGRDVLGVAQTGTGKTAAFALPILQRLSANQNNHAGGSGAPVQSTPMRHGREGAAARASQKRGAPARCLVLCPTRELATQIGDSFRTYGKHLSLKHTVIFGGVGQANQVNALKHGVDIIVATPGRLLDLLTQGACDLRAIEVLVLDEADRMLDMGFIHDVKKIVAHLKSRKQTLFFSATMPREIRDLADSLLKDPVQIEIAVESPTVDRVEQSVYFVQKDQKPELLAHLFEHLAMNRAIVFTRTKHGADRVVRRLHSQGIRAEAIHGNKSQNARERALSNFRSCKTPILVATDIASRGIDIDDVSHVVNYDLTHEPETYVHRIGRTARAGAKGKAVSFCDREELGNLRAIERLIRKPIPVENDHPHHSEAIAKATAGAVTSPTQRRGERGGRGNERRSHGGPNGIPSQGGRAQGAQSHGGQSRGVHPQGGHGRRSDAQRGTQASNGSPRRDGDQRRQRDGRDSRNASAKPAAQSNAQSHAHPKAQPKSDSSSARQKRMQPGRGPVKPRKAGHPLFA